VFVGLYGSTQPIVSCSGRLELPILRGGDTADSSSFSHVERSASLLCDNKLEVLLIVHCSLFIDMTQAIATQHPLIEKFENLTPQQQQTVLDFVAFLESQNQETTDDRPETEPISAYEAAKEFAGCVDGGPGDLSTNKKYLEGIGH